MRYLIRINPLNGRHGVIDTKKNVLVDSFKFEHEAYELLGRLIKNEKQSN